MLLLTTTQEVDFTIQPADKFGNPAKVDGVPVWNVSDEGVGSLVISADGLTATFKALGPVGNCQVSATADADLGEGMKSISGTADIQVESGAAVAMNLVAGAPREQA